MWNVYILSYIVCQFVVLLFFEVHITLDRSQSNGFILEYVFDDRRIVEYAMNISTNTMVCLHDGLIGIAHALMNFVTLTRLPIKLESDLFRCLFSSHRCLYGKKTKTRQGKEQRRGAAGTLPLCWWEDRAGKPL